MDTAGPSTKTNADAVEKSEFNRSLKRNIGELATEIKMNGTSMPIEDEHFLLTKLNFNLIFRRTEIAGT